MEWITLFLVALGFGLIALSQGTGMAALGFASVFIGLMVGYYDMSKEATQ